ncbi:solute carrier family 43 member 3-like isoform X2 [Homarus americanus]|uniref:solute carrier family 43 member 3-like isoform X2 n=2 Tax=Homarus americanus TaxID=6706 RepID=UPI001C492FF4|nr:solute carrier family 43 member 3-like isoform X2 [Homarus americanus]
MWGVCRQPRSVDALGRGHRWLMFLVGVVETMLWSGTIFGWASLVHVLKSRGVYTDLCDFLTPNATHTLADAHDLGVRGCVAQDEKFAMVYTVACVLYSTPGVLVGYSLHHLGLAFTRVLAGFLISGGFLLLSFTTAASPDYLWGASILLSVGGNTIRMAGLQLGNLFPQRRNTAMAIISGIFTPSAGLFMVLQSMFEKGLKWEDVCMGCSAVTFLIILFTPLFPRHHVPYGDVSETTETENTEKKRDEKPGGPLSSSIISVSSFLYLFWLFNNLFAVVLFGTYFNSWINKFSKTEEEAGFYSRLFGYANLLCALVTPLPGLMVDCISSVLKRGFQRSTSTASSGYRGR